MLKNMDPNLKGRQNQKSKLMVVSHSDNIKRKYLEMRSYVLQQNYEERGIRTRN